MLREPEEHCLHIVHRDEDRPLTREEGAIRQDLLDRVIEDQTESRIIIPAITVLAEERGEMLAGLISQGDCWLEGGRV